MRIARTAILCAMFLQTIAIEAQRAPSTSADVKAQYTKREVRIHARDGVELFTTIYAPRDTTKSYPIMLMRTPYGVAPYGDTAYAAALGPWRALQDDGYIFINQDVRGRYMSDGYYAFMTPHVPNKRTSRDVDESSDTYDTIDWLVKNVPHNGSISRGAGG